MQDRGVSAWTTMIVVCWSSAVVFPALTLLGGTMQPWTMLWQPAVLGLLFISGMMFTFLSVDRGDVSIAAPVLGIKVLLVPAFSQWISQEVLPVRIWIAAGIAVVGIACVQSPDKAVNRSRILAAVVYALLAATSMTLFDLLIQEWAQVWGAGYLLPLAFVFAAVLSLAFTPLADRPTRLKKLRVRRTLAVGSILMAVQAIGMTLTLGVWGDATRVNIVYSLRGFWGVVITWILTSQVGHRTMAMRLIGAVLIGVSVIISVTA